MTSLATLARRWMRSTETGKGIKLDQNELALLNAVGAGELILSTTAKGQRAQCLKQTMTSIQGGNTGLDGTKGQTGSFEPDSSKSIGMMKQAVELSKNRQGRVTGPKRKTRLTEFTSKENEDKQSAPLADKQPQLTRAFS